MINCAIVIIPETNETMFKNVIIMASLSVKFSSENFCKFCCHNELLRRLFFNRIFASLNLANKNEAFFAVFEKCRQKD